MDYLKLRIKNIRVRFVLKSLTKFIINFCIALNQKDISDQTKMTEDQWIDITDDILKFPQSFKLLQTVRDQKFQLEDSMHAHQINDNKIDPKFNITEKDTIRYMLEQKLIKLPQQLSVQELLAIFVQTYKFQSLILKGYPLHNTVYTFTYLYDREVYSKNRELSTITQAIYTLVNSINSLGSYFYELHKESSSMKEDDLSITMYSFSTLFDSHEQIIKEFNSIQTALVNEGKEKKDKSVLYNQLISVIKLRRSLHNLAKSMGKHFDNKLLGKIQKDIQSVHTIISSVKEQFNFAKNEQINTHSILNNTGIYSQSICKTLRTHFGPRQLPAITLKQSVQHIESALEQFSLFIPVPTRLSILKERIERLASLPLNIWSKSYIKNNVFLKEEHIFSTYRTEDLILNDMNQYVPIKENWKHDEKFIALIKPTAPVISEVLFRYLGRDSRSFWEVSKVYEDYNILIHLANQFDGYICLPNKKQLHVSSWFYNFGLNVMIKQLFSGIEIDLYQQYEYPYVFYLLENLLSVYDRNSQIFLKKFDKPYYQSFVEDTLNNKKKKKVPQATRKYFTDTVFKKALHYYVRSMHRILFVLVHRKLIENPFAEHLETRIKNRFRIFKNVYFVRTIDYQQYVRDYDIICQDQSGYLTQAMELLKQARTLFQKITLLEDSDCFFRQREDAQILAKICVKCSLAVMSLKMGQNTKTFKIENKHPKYPEISVC